MKKLLLTSMLAFGAIAAGSAQAQSVSGALVAISGHAELKAENNQATVVFYIEEQDKDKAVVASRVNQKMKTGLETLKKEDASAEFTTRGYYTYPIYDQSNKNAAAQRQIIGWRAGQYLEMKTANLRQLAATAAAGQKLMALNGVNFGLRPETVKQMEAERIAAGYKNFYDKVGMLAAAMGKHADDASIELLDFDGAGAQFGNQPVMAPAAMMMRASMKSADVAEPSFEPGYTELSITVNGKVRFK